MTTFLFLPCCCKRQWGINDSHQVPPNSCMKKNCFVKVDVQGRPIICKWTQCRIYFKPFSRFWQRTLQENTCAKMNHHLLLRLRKFDDTSFNAHRTWQRRKHRTVRIMTTTLSNTGVGQLTTHVWVTKQRDVAKCSRCCGWHVNGTWSLSVASRSLTPHHAGNHA